MAWIESHQGIKDHPKTIQLSALMKWNIDTTIGKLHRFWWWCLDYSPDGLVSRHSADMVALAIGLKAKDGRKLIDSLYVCGFLDKTDDGKLLIHDWLDYVGRYLRDTKYRRKPEKLAEIKELYNVDFVSRQSADSQPYLPTNPPDQPDHTPSPAKRKGKPNPPKNLEEVIQYAKDRTSCLNPVTFWEYFEASEPKWHDGGGKPVLAWKQKFITWESREKEKQAKQNDSIWGEPERLN